MQLCNSARLRRDTAHKSTHLNDHDTNIKAYMAEPATDASH